MSKKILCLLLALLMLAFTFPVMAAESEGAPVYSTSFGTINNDPKSCQNLPTIDEEGNVTYHGNWTPIGYQKGAYSNPENALLFDADCSQVGLKIDGSIAPKDLMSGGGSPSMKIFNQAYGGGSTTTYWAYYGQIGVTGSYSAGVRYTAEKSGTVDIILDAVGKMACLGRDSDEFRYGIFRNGEMIWPVTDGTTLADTKPLHELFAGKTAYENLSDRYPVTPDGTGVEAYRGVEAVSSLFILEGDTLDFIVEMVSEDGKWYNGWEGLGNVFFPTINYMSVLKETEMTASVTLGEGFGLSLGFAAIDPIYTDVRVKVNGETLTANEDGKYIYNDIAAKEIGEELYWEVTGALLGKQTLLAEGEVQIDKLLYENFVKDKGDSATRRLAIAVLNYGAAAQQHFKGMTSGLANSRLSATEKTVTLAGTYEDRTVLVADKADAAVDLVSASLLLNNTVDVKFVAVTNKDVTNYRLQVASDADFTDAVAFGFAKCKKGRQEVPYTYKVILDGIAPDAWDDVIYVRVIDKANGDAVVSKTVRYSAAIYYARKGDSASALLTAMMAVNEAAAAYTAE